MQIAIRSGRCLAADSGAAVIPHQPSHLRLELADPVFFATPLKKLTLEENAGTGRTYIMKGDRIVAVAKPREER